MLSNLKDNKLNQLSLFKSATLYEEITHFYLSGLSVDNCIPWLINMDLTKKGESYQVNFEELSNIDIDLPIKNDILIRKAIPCQRVVRKKKIELEDLEKQYKGHSTIPKENYENIWNEYKKAKEKSLLIIDLKKLPADALAFYRPFHFEPYEEWGIYLMVDKIVNYCNSLLKGFSGKLNAFNFESLLSYILFEVFHHEFFHHIVESAATTIEILSAGFGKPKKIYLDYFYDNYENTNGLGEHPHKPLEEALANAYAYNSFSFISRVKMGYKLALVAIYQELLKQLFPREPKGYCFAGYYINSGYINGAAQLLSMILNSSDLDPGASLVIANNVLLKGHSAFMQKPDVPTYLVGSEYAMEMLRKYIPAPNETYTGLFSPFDTSELDKFLEERLKQEKEAKKQQKAKK